MSEVCLNPAYREFIVISSANELCGGWGGRMRGAAGSPKVLQEISVLMQN